MAGISEPGLIVVGIVDPRAQVLGGVRRRRRTRASRGSSGASGRDRSVPLADRAADRVAVDAGGRLEDARGPVARRVRRGRRLPLRRHPALEVLGACRRRRAAASWRAGCRSTRRTGRGRGRAAAGSIHIWLTRFGIRSVLPASRGTQKLWATSADEQRAGRSASGARGSLTGTCSSLAVTMPELRVAELPPPLVADDRDLERAGRPRRVLDLVDHARGRQRTARRRSGSGDHRPRHLDLRAAVDLRRLRRVVARALRGSARSRPEGARRRQRRSPP